MGGLEMNSLMRFSGLAKPMPESASFGVNVHFAVRGSGNRNVAGSIVQLEADGAFDAQGAIEAAVGGRAHSAARGSDSGEEQK